MTTALERVARAIRQAGVDAHPMSDDVFLQTLAKAAIQAYEEFMGINSIQSVESLDEGRSATQGQFDSGIPATQAQCPDCGAVMIEVCSGLEDMITGARTCKAESIPLQSIEELVGKLEARKLSNEKTWFGEYNSGLDMALEIIRKHFGGGL